MSPFGANALDEISRLMDFSWLAGAGVSFANEVLEPGAEHATKLASPSAIVMERETVFIAFPSPLTVVQLGSLVYHALERPADPDERATWLVLPETFPRPESPAEARASFFFSFSVCWSWPRPAPSSPSACASCAPCVRSDLLGSFRPASMPATFL